MLGINVISPQICCASGGLSDFRVKLHVEAPAATIGVSLSLKEIATV